MENQIPKDLMIIIKDIITEVNNDAEKIICIMQTIDPITRTKEYLTFDTALSYLTYNTIINMKNKNSSIPINNCKLRIDKNIKEINSLLCDE